LNNDLVNVACGAFGLLAAMLLTILIHFSTL
jgi:hypothetical protein